MGYRICPYCGAALDAAEKCDCRDETALAGNAAPQEKSTPVPDRAGNIMDQKEDREENHDE